MSAPAFSTVKADIELRNVRKSFGAVDVIHGLDLTITGGEFVVFVGPSGCGKSTLLRMIAGLEEVTDGDILIGGQDVTDADPARRGIAMVFQSYALYPHMSVRENLAFGLKIARTPAEDVDRQVKAAADILKIDHLLDRRPGQLSGGQRQRVAIGRAIVRKPLAFLFDEPLSNLDAELRVSMRIELARLHRELGNTMVYVTHDQIEAMTLADKIVVLREGRIEQVGTPRSIYEDPNNVFVAGFVGSPRMNLLRGTLVDAATIEAGGARFALPQPLQSVEAGTAVQLGVRPEHLGPGPQDPGAVAAQVDFSEYLGNTRYLYCVTSNGDTLVVEQRTGTDLAPGASVWLHAAPAALRVFAPSGARLR
ncbi:MAG TPA: ABC transporter ATP-binding protein [Ramlibacter sp.]|jgi:lactose/L-arabinose transport system ATP-binding protein